MGPYPGPGYPVLGRNTWRESDVWDMYRPRIQGLGPISGPWGGPKIGLFQGPVLAKSMDSTREFGLKTWNRIWAYFRALGLGPQI